MDGRPLAREHQLLSVQIVKEVNRIARARLAYLDGTASSGDFPLSNADAFVPGKSVEILAGSAQAPVSLFKGVVVGQTIKVREHAAPQLVVECRHQAVKLTVGRKSAYYFDQKDSDVIASLLQDHGIPHQVEATPVTHNQQVQYYVSDWDFLMMRAEACGKLVFTHDDSVTVKAPDWGGAPVATLAFGATILEMDAEMDARPQMRAVRALAWDAAQQEVVEKEAADPGVSGPGNLSADDLAGAMALDHLELQSGAISEAEAQVWADSQWLKSRMSKVSGRIKCEGLGGVNPGDKVTLSGVGNRYSGDVFVTGVHHTYDTVQGWKTHIQFGSTLAWHGELFPVAAPKAAALVPGVNGLQIGVVVGNEDPEGEDRVRVRMPLVDRDGEGTWARVAAVDAGSERGFFFRPEIDDEVILGFVNDDPRQAVILGMLHSSARPAPLRGSDANHEKVVQTRSRMKVYLNDEKKVMQLETPAGNRITLSEEERAIHIVDQNGNKIEMTSDGITIESAKALSLKAGTELKLDAGQSFNATGGTTATVKGASAAEVSSTGSTTVKGSLVKIN